MDDEARVRAAGPELGHEPVAPAGIEGLVAGAGHQSNGVPVVLGSANSPMQGA